jgi:hypothetical protein
MTLSPDQVRGVITFDDRHLRSSQALQRPADRRSWRETV